MPISKFKPARRLREIVRSCATCNMLILPNDKLVISKKDEKACRRPGGPKWSDRRKNGSPLRYVCDRWRKKK